MPSSIVRRAMQFTALVVLLASVYMLTYSGRIESGDSLMYFNATGSLTRYGDTGLDLTLWYKPPDLDNLDPPYPLRGLEVESLKPPLQPMLATPLYWIASQTSTLGLVHTVWLFNIFVGALAGGVVFLYALALGYRERTAVAGALAFGLGTIIWPYSKTFFRDPLALLLILLAGLTLEWLRRSRFRAFWLIPVLALIAWSGVHTKTTVIFALPGLAIILLPNLRWFESRRATRIMLNALLVMLISAVIILIYTNILGISRHRILGRFIVNPSTMRIGLHSYLFSIGGSVWGTSPVILLAVPGMWLIYRRKTNPDLSGFRYIWVAALITLGYAFSYALLTGTDWFGGLSWPPRLMLPTIPFLVLLTLPVFDRLLNPPISRWLMALTVIVLAYSLWVQFAGVSVEWGWYSGALPPESGGLTEWGPGLNQIRYLRWVVIPGLWSEVPLDFAWVRVHTPGWAIAFTALALGCTGTLWYLLRRSIDRWRLRFMVFGLPVVFGLLAGLGLRGIYADPVYLGDNDSLYQMLDIIDDVTEPGDFLMLNDNTYERFFLNYAKLKNVRALTLPIQPGERPSIEQPAEVTSDNPDALLTRETLGMIYQLSNQHDHLWLLMNRSIFIPWSVRPVERFIAAHFYPIREIQTDPPDATLRLIEFSTVDAPDPYAFRGPDYLDDHVFGDSIHLAGYTLPSGTTYAPGDILPLSLYWFTDAPLDQDYTVAWKLINLDGTVMAEAMDSRPHAGFFPTNTWQAGVPVWDNRAMRLPDNLPPGEYRMWILLYTQAADGTIRNLSVSGGKSIGDGTINVLSTPIHLTE